MTDVTNPEIEPVLRRWQELSAQGGWRDPSDWWTLAAEALAEAVVGGRDAGAAADRLGAARASAGVGVAEALEDLGALYVAARTDGPALGVVAAFTQGWADVVTGSGMPSACEDPATGLATLEHLATRLRELVREQAGDDAPAQTHVLGVLDSRRGSLHHTERLERDLVLAQAARATFPRAVAAALGPGRAAVLLRRTPDAAARLGEARAATGLDGTRCWFEPIPPGPTNPRDWLRDLAR